ncbi:MAG: hypothetical protein LCH76_07265 [Actinobacteria bacterium]|nr:hypothetical protein [Actinomycetota bacterium]
MDGKGWWQRWSLFVHRLKYGKIAPGSPEHLEIIRIEEQRAEQMRKAMEERRRFGKY